MIVLDAEFTGLDPREHSLISIGAIDFENPENQFYIQCRPWDGADYMEEAFEVNGLSMEKVNSFEYSLEEAMEKFLEWTQSIDERNLAGQNVSNLDMHFLMDSARRYHLNWDLPYRSVDVHTLAYMHLVKREKDVPVENRRSAINSSFVQDYVGIPEEPKPHNALNGAKVAAEAISRLLYGKNLLPEFKDNPIPEYLIS